MIFHKEHQLRYHTTHALNSKPRPHRTRHTTYAYMSCPRFVHRNVHRFRHSRSTVTQSTVTSRFEQLNQPILQELGFKSGGILCNAEVRWLNRKEDSLRHSTLNLFLFLRAQRLWLRFANYRCIDLQIWHRERVNVLTYPCYFRRCLFTVFCAKQIGNILWM